MSNPERPTAKTQVSSFPWHNHGQPNGQGTHRHKGGTEPHGHEFGDSWMATDSMTTDFETVMATLAEDVAGQYTRELAGRALSRIQQEREALLRVVEVARSAEATRYGDLTVWAPLREALGALRSERVLYAADRVREAYDAMVEGKDLGSLPDWVALDG